MNKRTIGALLLAAALLALVALACVGGEVAKREGEVATATPFPSPTMRVVEITATFTPQPSAPPKPTDTPRPTATTAPEVGSRDKPVPFGEQLGLVVGQTKKFNLAITEAYRGDVAWRKIHEANQFNDKPAVGKEYLLLHVTIAYLDGPKDDPLELTQYDFNIVSKNQVLAPPFAIVEPEPQFEVKFFPPAQGGGWQAWEIFAGDEAPLLVIGMTADGSGGFYLEALPKPGTITPTPTSKPQPPAPTATPFAKTLDMETEHKAGTWGLRLYAVKRAKTVYWFGDGTTATGTWAVPLVEFRNLGDATAKPSSALKLYLQDARGRKFKFDYTGNAVLGAGHQFQAGHLYDEVNPGLALGIAIPVDVPPDVGDMWLRVEQHPKVVIYIGNVSQMEELK